MSREYYQRIAIAFIYDTDFFNNGKECEENMMKIMDMRKRLHESIGSKLQIEKTH